MSEAGTVAVSRVEETNVVASGLPFQFTVEVEMKLCAVHSQRELWAARSGAGWAE